MILTLLLSYQGLFMLLMVADKQWSDREQQPIILCLRDGELPDNVNLARRIVTESALYTVADDILYYVDSKSSEIPGIIVPAAFQQ